MSYDLLLLRRQPDQTWQQAMEALEMDDSDEEFDEAESDSDFDDDVVAQVDPAVWEKILAAVRAINPSIEDDGDEMLDEDSIQISCWADEASVSVPYWYAGDAARAVVVRMFAYAAAVEQATGLECYDPQLEMPLAEAAANVDAAVACFDQVAEMFASRGISSPSSAGLSTED